MHLKETQSNAKHTPSQESTEVWLEYQGWPGGVTGRKVKDHSRVSALMTSEEKRSPP